MKKKKREAKPIRSDTGRWGRQTFQVRQWEMGETYLTGQTGRRRRQTFQVRQSEKGEAKSFRSDSERWRQNLSDQRVRDGDKTFQIRQWEKSETNLSWETRRKGKQTFQGRHGEKGDKPFRRDTEMGEYDASCKYRVTPSVQVRKVTATTQEPQPPMPHYRSERYSKQLLFFHLRFELKYFMEPWY